MKKTIVTLLIICSLCLFLSIIINNVSYATSFSAVLGEVDNQNASNIGSKITKIGGSVVGVLKIVGVTVATIILLAIAIKYMTAAPGERADIKKNAIPFVIGAFVLFGATGILTIYQNIADSIGK